MWRASHKLSAIQNVHPQQSVRTGSRRIFTKSALRAAQQSQPSLQKPFEPPPRKRGGSYFTKLLGLAVVGASGVVGYCWYEPEFRSKVEMNILFGREVLSFLDKYLPPSSEVLGKKELPQIPWLSGLTGTGSEKPALEIKEAPSKMVAATPVQAMQTTGKTAESSSVSVKDKEKERLKSEKHRKEKDDVAQNQALELILVNISDDALTVVELAITAMEDALKVTTQHTQHLKQAMDDAVESGAEEKAWEALSETTQEKTDALQAVEKANQKARQQLVKLKTSIEDGKKDAVTKKNKILTETESQLSKLDYRLGSSEGELNKALSEGRIITEFRDLVKKGQQQFKKELESIRPDVKIGGRSGDKLTEDDLNSLIAHAHRRITQIQRQSASQQVRYQHDLELALARQCEEGAQLAQQKMTLEQRSLRNEFEMEKAKWEYEANEALEKEIRVQLSRQTAAHSDHLAEVLKVQEATLRKTFNRESEGKILDERERMRSEIILWISRMEGIEHALENRAGLEKQARKAQELWLACQALMTSLADGQEGATDEAKLKPLHNEVDAVAWAGNDHIFVNTVADTIPERALDGGVWTEEALVFRFDKVRRLCRRVAMIDERGGTLLKYFLSYVQSLFVFTMSKPLSDDASVDPDSLGTFRLVDNAQYCLARGDLEQALRFMNQLRGAPRAVASDWIAEVRLYLETRQATNALLAHASASGLGSLF